MIDQRNMYNTDKKANPNKDWENDTKKDPSPNQDTEKKDAPFTPNFPQPNGPEIADPQANKKN